MARQKQKLYVTAWGQVDQNSTSAVVSMGSSHGNISRRTDGSNYQMVYAKFESLSSALKNKRLYSVTGKIAIESLTTNGTTGGGYPIYLQIGTFLVPANASFSPSTLVWSNRPGQLGSYELVSSHVGGYETDVTLSLYADSATAQMHSELAAAFLKYNAGYFYESIVNSSKAMRGWLYRKLEGGGTPYIEIEYDDSVNVQSKITQNGCPTSGYFNPRNARKFSWTFEKNDTYSCMGGFTQASATLYWRESGASTWNSIAASGSTQNVTVPANTFPTASTIEWYLSGTDNCGTTSSTEVYTISTAAPLLSATLQTPVNSVEDGSQPITFSWDLEDAANTRGIWLGYTTTYGGSLTALSNRPSGGAITEFTAAAGTFPAGTVYWGLYVYNQDGTRGSLISSEFVSIAAPDAPTALTATTVPFTTISWQSAEQEAYRIYIDEELVKTGFGSAKTYTVDEPLSDGTHSISVQVQGVYGLWSNAASVSVSIQNSGSGTLTLSVEFQIDASLSWTSTGTGEYFIYRDGIRIGHTAGTEFSDRYVLGSHGYYVLQKLSSGDYLKSDIVALDMFVNGCWISRHDNGGWIELKLSENSDSEQTFSYSRTHSLRHVMGASYPVLEVSPYEDLTASYDCAFTDRESELEFRNMIGHTVILKSRNDQVIIGLLTGVQKNVRNFYNSYLFSIQQIHWEDYVDEVS